jgi:hypothetical protein
LQLDDFILYLDENLDNCKPILDVLLNNRVQHHRHSDHFARGVADEVWLEYVAERAWVVLTKDKRNRYNELERVVLRQYGVREFYFGSGNVTGTEMAQALVIAIPRMRTLIREYGPPLVGSIARSGHITVVYDESGSTHQRRRSSRE